jgi:hypothetical protein
MHNRIRSSVLSRAGFVIVLHAAVFSLLSLLDFGALGALPTILAALFTGAPAFVVLFVVATVRPMVARREGLEVEGELVPWGATTELKIGFLSLLGGLSRPAHAWMTVSGQGWRHDLMVVADPSEIDAMKRLRSGHAVSAYRS